jgi:hypothetical protein
MGLEACNHFKPFPSQSVVMLNVLQERRLRSPFHFEIRTAVLAGALLAMASMAISDHQAAQALSAQQLEKENLLLQVNNSKLNEKHSPSVLTALEQSIREQQQWLDVLQAQQQIQEDLMAVQDLLFLRRLENEKPSIQMQHLVWQDGALDWEGISSNPEALQAMLRHLSQFPRWIHPPGLVQVEALTGPNLVSASAYPAPAIPSSPLKQHTFKLTGRIANSLPVVAVTEIKP